MAGLAESCVGRARAREGTLSFALAEGADAPREAVVGTFGAALSIHGVDAGALREGAAGTASSARACARASREEDYGTCGNVPARLGAFPGEAPANGGVAFGDASAPPESVAATAGGFDGAASVPVAKAVGRILGAFAWLASALGRGSAIAREDFSVAAVPREKDFATTVEALPFGIPLARRPAIGRRTEDMVPGVGGPGPSQMSRLARGARSSAAML